MIAGTAFVRDFTTFMSPPLEEKKLVKEKHKIFFSSVFLIIFGFD